MTVLGDKLVEAINAKNNDVKSFIWKGEKKEVNKQFVQEEIKLVDATKEQLETFYKHCNTMLYNKDKKNPGRYVLLNIIKEQRENCNVELFLKYITTGNEEHGIKPIPKFSFLQAMKTFLDNNKEALPKEVWDTTPITVITNVPVEFSNLTIDRVYKAFSDSLGVFDRKHLTNTFIIKMGLWFSPSEIKDLTEKDEETGETLNRLEVVKNRCNLKNNIKLKINQHGLSYKEFRAMINLKSTRYSELTTDQLTILRDKILFKLEDEIQYHISQWERRQEQIKMAAEYNNIKLECCE